MTCFLLSLSICGRRVVYIAIRDVPESKIRPEPARLTARYNNATCTVKIEFISGITLELTVTDQEHILENCDEVFIEVSTGGRLYKFKSCYKIGDQWYIDYIGAL